MTATWRWSWRTTRPDIVMFDVPPPEQGVRGLEAYRATWPGFFDWQASGACSRSSRSRSPREPTSRSPSRCCAATRHEALERHPEHRLRLTVGLRKEDGRWIVTHEHHSFADAS